MNIACHKKENRTGILARMSYALRNYETETMNEKLVLLRDLGPQGHKNRFQHSETWNRRNKLCDDGSCSIRMACWLSDPLI